LGSYLTADNNHAGIALAFPYRVFEPPIDERIDEVDRQFNLTVKEVDERKLSSITGLALLHLNPMHNTKNVSIPVSASAPEPPPSPVPLIENEISSKDNSPGGETPRSESISARMLLSFDSLTSLLPALQPYEYEDSDDEG
jgi:hypothetical protein